MTLEEAFEVAKIATTADGGCSVCVRCLFELLQETFTQFEWEAIDSYSGIVKVTAKYSREVLSNESTNEK